MKRVELFCATSNEGKLFEFQQAAGEDVLIRGLPAVDCPETGETFEENAIEKAVCYSESVGERIGRSGGASALVFADDSGLQVDALGGAPGIYSARFAGEDATDAANNQLLVDKLQDVPAGERTAQFVCCIVLTRNARLIKTFHGEVTGRILEVPRGEGGFGYDPLFFLPELEATFAELTPGEKWRHSHRGRAFEKLLAWLRESASS